MAAATQCRRQQRWMFFLAVPVVMWLAPSATADCPGNLLLDPGLEAGDPSLHWGSDSSGDVSSYLHRDGDGGVPAAEGDFALRFHPRLTADVPGVGQDAELPPGDYTLSFDILIGDGEVSGNLFIRVDFSEQRVLPLGGLTASGAYERVVIPVTIPDTGLPVTISIWNPALAGGPVYIDNLCLTAANTDPICPGNILGDPGFEVGDLSLAWGEMASGSLEDMLYTEDGGEWPVTEGQHALRFRARMTDDVLAVGQLLQLEAGQDYMLAFDLLITEPASNGAVAVAIDGRWEDYIRIDELPYTGAYQRIEVALDAVESEGLAVLTIENPFQDGGDILLDNLCLTPVNEEPIVITAVHVQLTINAALGLGIEPGFQPDANADGTVDALDVQLMINAALGISAKG